MRPTECEPVLRQLTAAYQHSRLDEDATAVWARHLQSVPLEVALFAATDWIENEDRFPTVVRFHEYCQRVARRLAVERATEGDGKCSNQFCDNGFVTERSAVGGEVVKPCHRCKPEAYERWRSGHYAPDHFCEDCDDLRTRRRRSKGSRG